MVQTSITSWLKQRASLSKQVTASTRAPNVGVELSEVEPSHGGQLSTSTRVEDVREQSLVPGADKSRAASSTHRLPKNVQLVPISEPYVNSFRRLVTLLLPIPYPDKFFSETVEDPIIASISCAALWHAGEDQNPRADIRPQLVAAIRCRLLASPPDRPDEKTPVLYISTITTLAPFRGHSLATSLLQEVMRSASQSYGVSTVMAHVWEANEDGLAWYKKSGFAIVSRLDGYYRRLAPQTAAFLIRKDFSLEECLGTPGGSTDRA